MSIESYGLNLTTSQTFSYVDSSVSEVVSRLNSSSSPKQQECQPLSSSLSSASCSTLTSEGGTELTLSKAEIIITKISTISELIEKQKNQRPLLQMGIKQAEEEYEATLAAINEEEKFMPVVGAVVDATIKKVTKNTIEKAAEIQSKAKLMVSERLDEAFERTKKAVENLRVLKKLSNQLDTQLAISQRILKKWEDELLEHQRLPDKV